VASLVRNWMLDTVLLEANVELKQSVPSLWLNRPRPAAMPEAPTAAPQEVVEVVQSLAFSRAVRRARKLRVRTESEMRQWAVARWKLLLDYGPAYAALVRLILDSAQHSWTDISIMQSIIDVLAPKSTRS
jgi:hypothetical protein